MELNFIKWIEHAGFMLEINGKNVYIDPFRISASMPKADLIFITHSHQDHLSDDDIAKIASNDTRFVAPKETATKISRPNVFPVEPNKEYEIEGIKFRTVPAYNISKEFHPRANGWVGYIIEAGGKTLYHPGDTDLTEEMKKTEADIVLLPIGGNYTMDLDEAVKAASIMKAKVFVPMHYRALLGKESSAKAEQEFSKRIKNSAILVQVQEPRYSFQ